MYSSKTPQVISENIFNHSSWQRVFVWPLLTLSLLFLLVYSSGLDQSVAAALYQLQGNHWLLKDHWFTETLLHQGVRQLNQVVVLLVLCYWLTQTFRGKHSAKIRALGVLLLSLLLCFASIALLKRMIPMECPWDLQAFGGTQPFIGLFSTRPPTMTPNQCFPAGHASIGYGWLGIYFFLRVMSPKQAATGLYCSICLGLLLGFGQQLRGAHFLSHDVATATICWAIAGLSFRYFYHPDLLLSQSLRNTNYLNPLIIPKSQAATAAGNQLSSKESPDV